MIRLVRFGVVAVLLLMSGQAARAQSCGTAGVSIGGTSANGYAFGAMGSARATAGQAIGCTLESSPGGPIWMSCYAKVGGDIRTCYSSDPYLAGSIAALTYNSYLYFSWASGVCNYVVVQTYSCAP